MVGIIVSTKKELELLKSKASNTTVEESQANLSFIKGTIHGKEVVITDGGVGKVNSTIASTLLIGLYKVKSIVNIGSAGGISPEMNTGDLLMANSLYYHDVDFTALDCEYGRIPNVPKYYQTDIKMNTKLFGVINGELEGQIFIGDLASGDAHIQRSEQFRKLISQDAHFLAVDTEGTAIAQTCYLFKIPFIVLRGISDVYGKTSDMSLEEYLKKSPSVLTDVILSWLEVAE